MARSTSAFFAPAFRLSLPSSAYSLKKYRCGFPGGGHGPPYPIFPKSFVPCRAPLSSDSLFGTPSGRFCVSAGKLNSTQCTHVPAGASGSSAINATLFVPAGGLLQCSSGERSSASHVYCLGIFCWAENELLVISSFMAWPPSAWPLWQAAAVRRREQGMSSAIVRLIRHLGFRRAGDTSRTILAPYGPSAIQAFAD